MRAAIGRLIIATGRLITAAGWSMMPKQDLARRVLERRGGYRG